MHSILHSANGALDVPDEKIVKSIEFGICKVNFAIELRVAYTKWVRKIFKKADV